MTTRKARDTDPAMEPFDEEVRETQEWFESPRFAGLTRLYAARQVV